MKLTIINRKDIDLDLFAEWLVEKLKELLRDSINTEKLAARDEKLNDAVTFTLKQTLSAEVVLKLAINSLEWKRSVGSIYEIEINKSDIVYGTKNTVYELAKYLEYGGVGIEPLYFFRTTFNEVAKNLQRYYETYLDLVGG